MRNLRAARGAVSLSLALALTGCSAAIRSTAPDPEVRLRDYGPVYLRLLNVAGARSASGAGLPVGGGAIISGQISDGERQAAVAAEALAFDLMAAGFEMVSDSTQARTIADFSIGEVKYDPLAGWSAEQAVLRFREVGTGRTLAAYRADSRVITPTVKNIIGNLAKAAARQY